MPDKEEDTPIVRRPAPELPELTVDLPPHSIGVIRAWAAEVAAIMRGRLDEDGAEIARLRALDPFEQGAAVAYLLAETPEDWCWQFGYHPFHSACRDRGPGQRRLTFTLLLPEELGGVESLGLTRAPRFYEDMTVNGAGASYLTLAGRAVARAKDYAAGRNQAVLDANYREVLASQSAAAELLKSAREFEGRAAIGAPDLLAAAMLVRLGLATVEDGDEGMILRLVNP